MHTLMSPKSRWLPEQRCTELCEASQRQVLFRPCHLFRKSHHVVKHCVVDGVDC